MFWSFIAGISLGFICGMLALTLFIGMFEEANRDLP